MTEQDIQFALGRHFFLKKICIPNVKYLYYAVPRSLYNDHSDDIDKLLGNAGLILIDEIDTFDIRGNLYEFGCFAKRAKARKDVYPLSPNGLMHYLRIGCMKWVNR